MRTRMLIDGEWCDAASGQTIEATSPATGESLGDVAWGALFSALTDAGYDGPVCIEVEDRAYEGSLADRKRALRQSRKFLEQFMG